MRAGQQQLFDRNDFPKADKINAAKGSFLLMEGEASPRGAYLLLEGEVEVFVDDVDGSETLLFTLGAGDLVGEMGLISNEKRMAHVRCLTPVRALWISKQLWEEQMKNEAFARKLIDSLVSRYSATQNVVRRLGQSQAPSRLGIYLLGLEEWVSAKGDTITTSLPTHVNLARMLNCTREHITKVLKQFNQAEAIKASGDGRKVIISRSKISKMLTRSRDGSTHL